MKLCIRSRRSITEIIKRVNSVCIGSRAEYCLSTIPMEIMDARELQIVGICCIMNMMQRMVQFCWRVLNERYVLFEWERTTCYSNTT